LLALRYVKKKFGKSNSIRDHHALKFINLMGLPNTARQKMTAPLQHFAPMVQFP
jgi:hypothetical protein